MGNTPPASPPPSGSAYRSGRVDTDAPWDLAPTAPPETLLDGDGISLRFIDWIWHVRGSMPLPPGQSGEEAFHRLDPLFRQPRTSHEHTNDRLIFHKKDQAAQDKMSVFDDGVLRIDQGAAGPVLRYDMTSRILLFCFLAPLLFLAIAQVTIVIGKTERPQAEAADTAKKDAERAVVPLHPIDVALGAPAPEKPGKTGEEAAEAAEGGGKKPSPTAAYIFAALFALLYVVGRILEDRLIRSLFRKRLLGSEA